MSTTTAKTAISSDVDPIGETYAQIRSSFFCRSPKLVRHGFNKCYRHWLVAETRQGVLNDRVYLGRFCAKSWSARLSASYPDFVAFRVRRTNEAVTVELSGWDRLFCWRRSLVVSVTNVCAAFLEARGSLEVDIDHRLAGFGPNNGSKHPGRRRVGPMLGRSAQGRQFWAVASGPPTVRLLVLDVAEGEFVRVVLEVDADIQAHFT